MIPITTYGQFLQTLGNLRSNQVSMAQAGQQLATGRKSDDLGYYGTQTQRLVDAKNFVARRESYLKTIDLVETRMKAYDAALNSLRTTARSIAVFLDQANTPGQAVDVDLAGKIDTAMNEVRFYLNQKFGDRYLFAGGRYTTEPVLDIASLADPAVGPPPANVASPTLTDYDTQAPGSDASAWAQEGFTADDGLRIDYGITSQDGAFQDLVMAMRFAKAATNSPANHQTYIDGARTLIERAMTGITTLQNALAVDIASTQGAREVHMRTINLLQSEQARIEGIDMAEVGSRINAMQTQIEATFAVTRTLSQLSLVNFLK